MTQHCCCRAHSKCLLNISLNEHEPTVSHFVRKNMEMVIWSEPGCTHGGRVGGGGLAKTFDAECCVRPKDRKLTPMSTCYTPPRGYYLPLYYSSKQRVGETKPPQVTHWVPVPEPELKGRAAAAPADSMRHFRNQD